MKLGKLLEAKEDLAIAEKLDPRNKMLLKQKKELQQLFMEEQKSVSDHYVIAYTYILWRDVVHKSA